MAKFHIVFWAVLATAGLMAAPAAAQEGFRVYQEELRVRLDEQNVSARETGFDGGGWYNFACFNFDDASLRRNRTLYQNQLRLWGSGSLQGAQRVYVRGLFNWDDWNHGDNGDQRENKDLQRIERAWYQIDFDQLFKNQSGQDQSWKLRTTVGREYVTLGTGLALAMPMDMVRIQGAIKDWEATAIIGQSVTHTPNIDASAAVQDHQERCLFGGEIAYTGLDHHRPFVYILDNEDHTDPWGKDPFQQYNYTSRYVGTGSTGTLVLPDLRYQTELVGEWGKTFSDGVNYGMQDKICAWAYDALLEYLFRVDMHPKVMVEYLHGSGDPDRLISNATVGGNKPGTTDRAFNAFGYRDTGLSFAPALSNMQVYTTGAGFYPLEHIELFRKLETGTKVFFYQKSTGSGGISDTTATRTGDWVGWEWDAYADWRITSDFTWTIRYGSFQPGDIFGNDRTCRQFVYTGITFSF